MSRALLALLLAAPLAQAQLAGGLGGEAFQLQQLIQTSQAELKSVQELLKVSQQDAKTLEMAGKSLDKLAAGLDRSIEKYQGSKTYEQALLMLQAEDLKERAENKRDPRKESARFLKFQSETLHANSENLDRVKALEESLRTAEHGFVGKIQGQAALGNWQTNARISAQLSELLSAIHGLREDMNGGANQGGLALLVEGSAAQSQKQREATAHAK